MNGGATGGGRVVVVGAGMAGLRAAEALRKAGWTGEVMVVGQEPHMPYNRPPLSKEALAGGPALATLAFRLPRAVHDVTWRLGERVMAADLDGRTVTTSTGDTLSWTGLVAASGLRPRHLALPGPSAGRHVLRTFDDALALRASLHPGARLVVVGAGFVGCEVAATATGLGVAVDVVAPEAVPMQRPLGLLLGGELQRRHEAHGVRFHLGTVPVGYHGADRVETVELADGTELTADLVVEAVGCAPETDWLAGTGLDLADGVLCDNALRADGRADVVVCGDLVRFPNPLFDDVPRRTEHWALVTDTGRHAGRTLAAHLAGQTPPGPFAPVPSFWSDQFDVRLQSFGAPELGDDVRLLAGDLGGDAAVGYLRSGVLVAVVMLGLTGRQREFRELVVRASPLVDLAAR